MKGSDNLSKTGFQMVFIQKILARVQTVQDTMHNYEVPFEAKLE